MPTPPPVPGAPDTPAGHQESIAPASQVGLLRRRPGVSVLGFIVLLITLGAVVFLAVDSPAQPPQARWQSPVGAADPSSSPSPEPSPTGPGAISLSATGDIIMGNAAVNRLPANDGRDFFKKIKPLLAADLIMGNLEQPITDDTGFGKCAPDAKACHQFRIPPRYAKHFKDAGFDLLNQANNHGRDFGVAGYTNTQRHLDDAGVLHTGATDQITVTEVKGVKVAVLGFSSYAGNNSLIDLAAARKVVKKAAKMADLVVIQVHMGAEGEDKSHVRPGTETFFGENRGDPIKFSRTVIDAGADLVIGHGPHVLRGMEFYKGKLIAYSLGNFAGGGSLNASGKLGWGGVLSVTLNPDGSFVTGEFRSTIFGSVGVPEPDSQKRGLGLVKQMTAEDFGQTGAKFRADGTISAPPAA